MLTSACVVVSCFVARQALPPKPLDTTMSVIDDLDDYKLEASFQRDPECILHTSYKSDRARGIHGVAVVDTWVPQKPDLGSGTFGTVRLEKRLNAPDGTKHTHRAVKRLHKIQMARLKIDYKKELIALTKFSRSKVCRLM